MEQGLNSYYRYFSDPNNPDSDGDGLDDGLEQANGTDPLNFDPNELGVDGLDLPPFTLFQSSLYDDPDEKPAVPVRYLEDDEGDIDLVFLQRHARPLRRRRRLRRNLRRHRGPGGGTG